ncbi:MAG: DedA family protein [Candidatus Yanofskybacteria bacterium]|nr:DedA family protein [Candidatus Yanofskybacteria bacterium]
MEQVLHILENYFPFIVNHKYVFFFFGSALEGLNLMVLAGFLVSAGRLHFVPVMIALVAGYMVNGYLWYGAGYFGGARVLDYLLKHNTKRQKAFGRLKEYFEEHTGKAIVFTKMTFSFTILVLTLAGSLRYGLKKFSIYNFIGSVGWAALTFSAGYFFGEGYQLLFDYWRNIGYFILSIVIAIAFVYGLKLLGRSVFIKSLLAQVRLEELNDKIQEGLEKMLSPEDEK